MSDLFGKNPIYVPDPGYPVYADVNLLGNHRVYRMAAVKENGEFIIMTYSTEYQDMHITKTKDTLTDDTLIEFTEFPVADPHGQAVTMRTVVCPADYFKD